MDLFSLVAGFTVGLVVTGAMLWFVRWRWNRVQRWKDIIRCPGCGIVQQAVVEWDPAWGVPWNSYVHECPFCGYVILESEWEVVL